MLESSLALKSDCSGLLGLTESAPAVAVRLTGADMLDGFLGDLWDQNKRQPAVWWME